MKKIKILLTTLLLCLPLFCVQAEEQDIMPIDKSTTIEVVEDSSFKADDILTAEENILGNVFYVGNNVTSKSIVDGIGFIAGNNVTIEGEKEYVISAGNNIYVKGNVEKDAFLAGNIIEISGNINRELYAAASSVTITGNIGRKVRIVADEIIMEGTIGSDVELSASKIVIKDGATITGTLKYNEDAHTEISDQATVAKLETYAVTKEESIGAIIKNYIFDFLTSYANLLVVALVLIYFAPKLFENLKLNHSKPSVENYFKLFAKGVLFLFGIPFIIIMLLTTYIGTSLGIILIPIYLILAYISIILTGYVVGELIWTRLFKKESNNYIAILIGVAVIKLLELVPFLGGIISMLSLFVGIGMVVELVFRKKIKA